ncbi:transposase [Frankia sp. Cas4]|uniref:transposase n=1 Tax=Frankia sp. Cas4 TaxID=3073927 RepID=UPI002AD2899F|nr:transposase [Frankia sp. Cas4]
MVADAAYAGKELRGLPARVTWTTRLRVDAALYDLAPPRTGRRGRPRSKGARLSSLTALAAQVSFAPLPVRRYRKTATVNIATVRCLWYGTFGPQPVIVILLRETSPAAAMTPHWSPPTPSPDRLRSFTGMPPAGRSKS